MTGAEANCTSGLCCRDHAFNSLSPNKTLISAPRFGAYLWYVCAELLSIFVYSFGTATRLSL